MLGRYIEPSSLTRCILCRAWVAALAAAAGGCASDGDSRVAPPCVGAACEDAGAEPPCTGSSCSGAGGAPACTGPGCGGAGGAPGCIGASCGGAGAAGGAGVAGGAGAGGLGGYSGGPACDGGSCGDAGVATGCGPTTCPDGCCEDGVGCVVASDQGDLLCGTGGQRCARCGELGETCHATLSVCTSSHSRDAEILRHDMPQTMTPGQVVTVTVVVRNTGTASWTAADGYKLGSQNPQDNVIWGVSRADLGASDDVATGGEKAFSLQITAPTTPGIYNFQLRMLQEGVEWFGDHSVYLPVVVGGGSATVCEAARALVNMATDATPTLQGCIDATPAGDVLELPAGVYRVDGKLEIAAAGITLRTEGKTMTQDGCAIDGHDCAELSASTAFADTAGILQVLAAGSHVDHLVINGNKTPRATTASGAQCAAFSNAYGYNMRVMCDDCIVTNSVSKNALCGTALEVAGAGTGVVIWRNAFADNGVHDTQGLWADGVTVHDYANSTFVANEFRDSTDIDLIFGGCQGCIVQDNHISHTADFAGGSFAALMLHAWPSGATSGNFTGTDTSRNHVDCGPSRRCGFGLYIGPDAWYDADTFGGEVHENVIRNAQQGVLVDDAHDMSVYNNYVESPGSSTTASCGTRATGAYGIGTTSANIDTSRDTMGATYAPVDFDACIPNWWQP